MRANKREWLVRGVVVGAALGLGGCVLAPKEAKVERARVEEAGAVYRGAFEKRALPEVGERATWEEVLRRAFLANGELEAAYHEWAGAVARIDQAGTWPNSPVSVGFEQMFNGERMKGWDRTTVSAGFDASESLLLPNKVYQSAKVATAEARAAGERFVAAKFALQRKVLRAWVDYALLGEKVRIQKENAGLLKLLNETAVGRVQAGGSQQDLLRTDIEWRMAENELATMEAEGPAMRAMLNALMGRGAGEALAVPEKMPEARAVPGDDELLAMGVGASPELAGLALQVKGRRDAVERARMEYLPDVSPFAAITGDVTKVFGADVMLPTAIPRIKGMVREARAELARAEAVSRQTRLERGAEFVAAVYVMRNAERQAGVFEREILPAARRVMENARQAYTAGRGGYLDLIEAQRTLLDVRVTIAEARAVREKALVDLEAVAGVDVETVGRGAGTRPATRPSTRPDGQSAERVGEQRKRTAAGGTLRSGFVLGVPRTVVGTRRAGETPVPRGC